MQTLLKPPKASKDGKGPLSSKNGSILSAVITAAVAGLLIVLFMAQYRNNVNKDGVPTPVLVAQKVIGQGASGETAGEQALFKSVEVPRDQLKKGAVTDPSALRGKVAVAQILPGQQLTATDFRSAGTGAITKLAADQRAMTVALDNAHGMLGTLRKGDHVDVLSGFELEPIGGGANRPVMRMLMQDVLVLDVPAKEGGGAVGGGGTETAEVTLRVSTMAAPKVAFAADNGKLWLVLRPQNGEKLDRSSLVTIASMLVDTKPVKIPRGR